MKKVTTNSFEADVLKSEKIVLVDFGAEWCAPCRALKPTLESLSKERTDVEFAVVDIDESDKLAAEYHIMAVPTLAVFKAGKLLDRISGNAQKSKIEELLNKHIA
jgi:thioredoxin 1